MCPEKLISWKNTQNIKKFSSPCNQIQWNFEQKLNNFIAWEQEKILEQISVFNDGLKNVPKIIEETEHLYIFDIKKQEFDAYIQQIENIYNVKIKLREFFTKREGMFMYDKETWEKIAYIWKATYDNKKGYFTEKHLRKEVFLDKYKWEWYMTILWDLYKRWLILYWEEIPNSDVTQKISVINWYKKQNFFPVRKIINGKELPLESADYIELKNILKKYKREKQDTYLPFGIILEKQVQKTKPHE